MINSTIERETKHDFGHLISSEDSGDMKQCYLKEEKKVLNETRMEKFVELKVSLSGLEITL